jgi:CRISPR-associated protein Csd1
MQFKDGKIQSVCTNQNNWLPDFLVGPVDEVFPGGVDGQTPLRFGKRRETWKLIARAGQDLPANGIIQGIKRFLFSRPSFQEVFSLQNAGEDPAAILNILKEGKENIAFRVAGRLSSSDPELLDWWRLRTLRQREVVSVNLPVGGDLVGNVRGPLAEFFPSVLDGTPMISYNKAPYRSFGMGSQTTPMLLENAEKCAAALNDLCDDPDNSFFLGGMQALCWASNKERCIAPGFGGLIEVSDPLAVKDFILSPWGGISRDLPNTKFHSLILKKTKGRFAVRHWHETTLAKAEESLRRWFEVLATVPIISDHQIIPCKLSELARCTIQKTEKSNQKTEKSKPLPRTYGELLEAALFSRPLPPRLFSTALERQALELAKGCDKKAKNEFEERLRARTALIKLYFELNKKGEQVTMENHTCQEDAAYLCGRLLALLDKVHVEAHAITIEKKGKKIKVGGTNTSPANRAYAAASTTPALIFPQLCKLARYHLNKVGGGWAFRLEHGYEDKETRETTFEGLKQVVARLQQAAGGNFPRTLSLEQQGRFAIGFYFERCRRWPEPENTKNDMGGSEEKEESKSSNEE